MKFNVRTVGITNNMIDPEVRKANLWLANEVLKDTRPFVPALTMSLNQRSRVEGTQVVYPGPYARYLYYGKVMEGPVTGPKTATSKDLVFTKSVHAHAQAFWFEASKAKNKKKWTDGAEKVIKRELNK